MTAAERYYRLVGIQERIEQINEELGRIADETQQNDEAVLLGWTMVRLGEASQNLRVILSTGAHLEKTLKRSIESAEQRRCFEVAQNDNAG
jgi:hypothetical protein